MRFDKNVWLTNHAIEAMVKRKITLSETGSGDGLLISPEDLFPASMVSN